MMTGRLEQFVIEQIHIHKITNFQNKY